MRGGITPGWLPYFAGTIVLIAACAVFAHLGVAVGTLLCSGGLQLLDGLWGAAAFIITGEAASIPSDAAGAVRVTAIVVTILVVVLLGLAFALIMRRVARWKQSEKWFARDLRRREGLARAQEVRQKLGVKTRLKQAKTVRPTLENPKPEDVGVRIGTSDGQPAWLSTEDSVALIGAPRMGKGFRLLIGAIIDWQGPLITTSTRNDNLLATMAMREKLGKVTVFDPQGLSGVRRSLRISPIEGCQDPLVAMQRAQAIMGGTALGASTTNAEWATEAETILSRLLLAAAVSGRDVTALRDWGAAPALARPAVSILHSEGPAGWGDSMAATLDADPKLLQSRWMGVSSALAPLQLPSVAQSMTPTGEDPVFDAEEFLAGANTLYLIGTRSGAGAAGGFLGAVLDDIVERARRKALRSPGSRLDPPLGLILDELANLFSWRALPTVLSDGGGIGIWTLVVLQALSQAETAWSAAEAQTIWSSSIAKILLGGGSDMDYLNDVSSLLGERKIRRESTTRSFGQEASWQNDFERVPVITAAELRRLPEGMGLLAYRNRRGILLDMPGWIDRPDSAAIKAGMERTKALQHEGFAAENGVR